MSAYIGCPYEGGSDLDVLVRFAQQVTRERLPASSYYHPGDLIWQLYEFDRSDDVRVWTTDASDDEILACAIFEPTLTFQFAVNPAVTDQKRLTTEILEWAEQRRALVADKENVVLAYRWLGSDTLSTTAMDTDPARIEVLVENGYVRRDQENSFRVARSLAEPVAPNLLPEGARFREMSAGDAEARAELHRDAWSVWGESQHGAELYRRLRSAPLYDPALDVVLEFEGQLVSYCLCWVDSVNRVGLFEPVGTRPSAARRGFGRRAVRGLSQTATARHANSHR